jgi:hypothetical protein
LTVATSSTSPSERSRAPGDPAECCRRLWPFVCAGNQLGSMKQNTTIPTNAGRADALVRFFSIATTMALITTFAVYVLSTAILRLAPAEGAPGAFNQLAAA